MDLQIQDGGQISTEELGTRLKWNSMSECLQCRRLPLFVPLERMEEIAWSSQCKTIQVSGMVMVKKAQAKIWTKKISQLSYLSKSVFLLENPTPIGTWELQSTKFLQNWFQIFLQFPHWYLRSIYPIRNRAIYTQNIKNTYQRKLILSFSLATGLGPK